MDEDELEEAASSPIEESEYCVGSVMGLEDLETVRLQEDDEFENFYSPARKSSDSLELSVEIAKSVG